MTKADELREALGNVVYDAQTPDGLRSPSAHQTAAPKVAAAICTTLGITRDMVTDLHGAGCGFRHSEQEKGRYSCFVCETADALTALLDLAEAGK